MASVAAPAAMSATVPIARAAKAAPSKAHGIGQRHGCDANAVTGLIYGKLHGLGERHTQDGLANVFNGA